MCAHSLRQRASLRRQPPPANDPAPSTGVSSASVVLPLHEHVAPEPKMVIGALTGVRAVAALWVVMAHFSPAMGHLFPWTAALWGFTWGGYLGVDLFFVLSGFILTHTYLDQSFKPDLRSYGRFLWLRLARIYPLHLATLLFLAVAVAVAAIQGIELNMAERFSLADLGRNLLLIHAWGFADDLSWNIPAWSISSEWFAYLWFPLILPLVARTRSRLLILSGSTLMYALLLGYFAIVGYSSRTLPNDGALIRIMTQFIVGCLLYRFYQVTPWRPWVWQVIAYLCVAGIAAYFAIWPATEFGSLAPAPLCAILVLALARANGPLAAGLASPFMLFWGEASYALYMTHDIWRLILNKLLPADRFADDALLIRLGVFFVYGVFIFGTAALTYLLLERPARRWMRHLLDRPSGPTQPKPTRRTRPRWSLFHPA